MSRNDLTRNEYFLLVDHILEGPNVVTPPNSPRGEYLTKSGTKLARSVLGVGTWEEIWEEVTLFCPPTDFEEPFEVLPLLRHHIRHPAMDREKRRAKEPIEWPAVVNHYHQMSLDDCATLDAHVRALQEAARSIDVRPSGLGFENWYRKREPLTLDLRNAEMPPVFKRFVVASNVTLDVSFHNDEPLELAETFDAAWQFLAGICASERKAEDVIETWSLTPEEFADRISNAPASRG